MEYQRPFPCKTMLLLAELKIQDDTVLDIISHSKNRAPSFSNTECPCSLEYKCRKGKIFRKFIRSFPYRNTKACLELSEISRTFSQKRLLELRHLKSDTISIT